MASVVENTHGGDLLQIKDLMNKIMKNKTKKQISMLSEGQGALDSLDNVVLDSQKNSIHFSQKDKK